MTFPRALSEGIPFGSSVAGSLYPERQAYVDATLIPMRRKRDVFCEGYRREGSGSYDFDPAPAWAAVLVDRLARRLLGRVPDTLLRDLTAHLLGSERRALAALVVIDGTVHQNKNWDKRLPLQAVRVLAERLALLP